MPQSIDTLITNGHLLTMAGEGVGYVANGAVAIDAGRIVAVGPTDELTARFEAKEHMDATDKAVLPGLIDAHMHTPWAVVRGVAQDVANWMQKGLAPYARHLTPEASLAGTRLNVLEGLKAGTTTFGDYGYPVPGWGEIFAQYGVRGNLTVTINAMPDGGMAGWEVGALYPLDEAVFGRKRQAGLAFADEWHDTEGGRIRVMLGPQGPDMLTKEQLLAVKADATKRGLRIHMHTAQGDRELDQMIKRYGTRSPAYLEQIGYLDDQLLAVHLTEATDDEAALIARSGASMMLCSGSIGIIDGIVPPAHAFRRAGGLVALGSDQAAGNNCNNVFNEMKLTALFNKIKFRDPTVMPAWEVLRMGTIEGAQALGLGDEIGSLETGKRADVILVDLTALNLTPTLSDPIRTLVPNLIYAGTGYEVQTVLVDGHVLMREREILVADEGAVQRSAQEQGLDVAKRVAADPVHEGMALLAPMAKGWL